MMMFRVCCGVALVSLGGVTRAHAQPAAASSVPPRSSAESAPSASDPAALAAKNHAEGVLFLRARKLEAAVQLLESAVALEPSDVIYVTDLGYAYLKQRRFAEAEALFKRAITLDPTRYHAYE